MSSNGEGTLIPPSVEDEKHTTPTLRDSDVNFAFGPQGWYWARCGTRWRFVRSQASDWDNIGIYTAYWVAFKHDTGFLIGGESEDGEGRVIHSWNDSYMVRADKVDSFVTARDAYIRLHDWMGERVHSDPERAKRFSVCIGPKGSYFARFASEHVAHALPKGLQVALQESESPPASVALGIKGAWIVLFCDGSRTWDLRDAYPSLAASGKLDNDSNKTVFVALNPYQEDCYFVVAENGACSYSIAFNNKHEGQNLHEMTDTYMRSRAKRDGTTFAYPMTLNGVEKQVRITPDSSAQEGKVEALMATLRARRVPIRNKDLLFVGAVSSSVGALAKATGSTTMKAVGVAASVGFGAALSTWYRNQ